MSLKRRFWFLAYPDLTNAIGGIKQIHRVAEIIEELGCSAFLVQDQADFHPHWFKSTVNTVARKEWINRTDLDPRLDVIILPETFVPLVPTLFPGIPKIIFNQNISYTFGLPTRTIYKPSAISSIYHHKDVLQIWCVSRSDYDFLVRGLDLSVSKTFRIVNALDIEDVSTISVKKKLQICYMSRKNSLDSACVLNILRHKKWLKGWTFFEIKNLTHDQVLSVMRDSLIFLSFGINKSKI